MRHWAFYICAPTARPRRPDWLDKLRALTGRRGGSAVVVKASPTLENRVDVWGELPGSRSLMRAVKTRFDPNGILNPGGGPGGL